MPNFNCDPNVDTAGLVDLSYGWSDCTSIGSFPPKDFSSGLNFNYTWANCSSMATISTLYLYNQLRDATEFVQTWEGCSSLTSFGALDLSSATLFDRTWKDCSSLTSFPFIFVDSGTTFTSTWQNCNSLTSFPLLNVSHGTNFSLAWNDCTSLTSFPELDTSQGTNFSGTWASCSSLSSFPLLNTSQGTSFTGTWAGCSSLSSFPLLNTSQGTNFWLTWVQCGGLTSFPLLNTSQGTNFQSTWEQCSGLTSFPPLNLSQGTNFAGTWLGCVSLADFPPNMFDSSLTGNFYQAWEVCALTPQSVENIFVSLDTSGVTGGTLSVAGGTNACSGDWTVLATAAYDSLISKSWTIYYNDCSPTFSTSVTPASAVEGFAFTVTVTTTNLPDGTVIPFVVSGSDALNTTSGDITISGNLGSATISTIPDIDTVDDIATVSLAGLATGLPGTTANFSIIESNFAFIGFSTGARYSKLWIVDEDVCLFGPNPIDGIDGGIAVVASGADNRGFVIYATGNYTPLYPLGTIVHMGDLIGSYPVLWGDSVRSIYPSPGCGNPTGYLVRLELSNPF